MIRAVSGVYPLPLECSCGADATTLDLDGYPACAECAAALTADPVARADHADRLREWGDDTRAQVFP